MKGKIQLGGGPRYRWEDIIKEDRIDVLSVLSGFIWLRIGSNKTRL
jgi:hypothetical protein